MEVQQHVQKTGYTGFGSFHSDNVEELIRQDDVSYHPPPLPVPDPCASPQCQQQLSALEFGLPMRSQFLIDFDKWTFVNHGAFGAVLRPVMEAAEAWRRHCEAQPLRFLDRELLPHLVHVTRQMARVVNCQPTELVLVPNATTGLNTVISSLARTCSPGDVLFSLNIGYGSVKKMLGQAAADSGATHVEGQVTFPLRGGVAGLVEQVGQQLPPHTRLAVFDAVTSNTALVLPLQQLIRLCHDRGCLVLVDAAHALGALPLDLGALEPDFLVTNCHKWWAGARGGALLVVAAQHQPLVRPLVCSHGAGAGFTSGFIWDGCRDYAPLLSLGTALSWWRGVGPPRAAAYQHQLLAAATGLLLGCWGTHLLVPLELCGAMALVALPHGVVGPAGAGGAGGAAAGTEAAVGAGAAAGRAPGGPITSTAPAAAAAAAGEGLVAGASGAVSREVGEQQQLEEQQQYWGTATSADAKYVQDTLHYCHSIEVPIKVIQGVLYARVSAGLYNVLGDYQRLADAVTSLLPGGRAGPAAAAAQQGPAT